MAKTGYEPIGLAMHDLDHGERIDVPPDPRAQALFQQRLERWIDGIRSSVFSPDTTACDTCDFRQFCPHAELPPAINGDIRPAGPKVRAMYTSLL